VEVLSRDAVARRLNLPHDLAAWLDSLEAVGPPPVPLDLPRGDAARVLLTRLGVNESDVSSIVESLPTAEKQPELWWLLERACHQVLSQIGDWDAGSFLPVLPKELGIQGECLWIFVFLATAEAIHRWHARQGISDEISWATLADLGLNVARNRRRRGVSGLEFPTWLGLHWRGVLYALGRLQFNPFALRTGPAGPLFWYEGAALEAMSTAFQPGPPVLGVHVPAGSPLDPAACDASFQAAASFFPRFFPQHASRLAVCTSWLLDEQLADYLPAESNIVRFQRRFELVPGAREDDDGLFLWVFDRVPAALDELQPRTELERTIVRHVRDGHHWRMRTGWLEI
jgi:hypothetical protein